VRITHDSAIAEPDFESIRPFDDQEINQAIRRVVAAPEFDKILDFLFPGEDKSKIIDEIGQIQSALEFQKKFMHPLVNSIVRKTSDGLTTSGFENLTKGIPFLFVGNHRDIVLDSAILQVILVDFGHETSEITFGSNLMQTPFIIDVGKINRMFKVTRGGNRMEFFRNSQLLSQYIRYAILQKRHSVWIAQRNGRTKDGSDKTETGLLKMFNMSGSGDFMKSFSELNIIPLSISYEYEPCCAYKIRELMSTTEGIPYEKEPFEDLLSIVNGITQPKGRIHLAACTPVNEFLQTADEPCNLNDKINKLASLIDETIYQNFRLWPANYISCDLLHNTRRYTMHYTPKDEEKFEAYVKKELSLFSGNVTKQRKLLLQMYAYPVMNAGQ
jgi:hypothetical protein